MPRLCEKRLFHHGIIEKVIFEKVICSRDPKHPHRNNLREPETIRHDTYLVLQHPRTGTCSIVWQRKNRAAVATIDELMAAREKLERKNASSETATTAAITTSNASNEAASNEATSTEATSTEATSVTSVSPQQSPATDTGTTKDSEEKNQHQKDIEKLRRAIEDNQLYLDPLFDRNKAVETFPELNVRTLSADFNLCYGMPFPRYLTMLRLDHALSLLCSNQDLSIETIATKSGFTTRQTFYRTFSERFGISPAEYRRMKKEV